MKAKRVFLNFTIMCSVIISTVLIVYGLVSFFMLNYLSTHITPIVVDIVNSFGMMTVEYEDVIDTVMICLIAGSFVTALLGILKVSITASLIRYYKMSYAEFYVNRFKFLGLCIAYLFTLCFVVDFLSALLALLIKNKNASKIESELSTTVKDKQSGSLGRGQGLQKSGGYSPTVVSAKTPTYTKPSLQSNTTQALFKAQELLNTGTISQKEYKKLVKSINKKGKQ